jgi:hypothetical protein
MRLIVGEWDHPHAGRQREVLCPEHERMVLGALRVLNIGSAGRWAKESDGGCTRCRLGGRRFWAKGR